jgi:hypothetical protein
MHTERCGCSDPVSRRRKMRQHNWGPRFIASGDAARVLSGRVLLKEELDEGLLRRDLDSMGLSGPVVRVMNHWFIRRLGEETWLQLGASDEPSSGFQLSWDSSTVSNGDYEVLEQMNVFVKDGSQQRVVARTNAVRVAVNN